MKMASKSLTDDDDDDSWVEAEIKRELESLTTDLDALDDACADEEPDHDVTTKCDNSQEEFSNVATPALDEYISKVNRQMEMMEMELWECDKVLQESEIVTARQPQNDAFLEALAADAGTDVYSFKQKILLELDAEEKAEKNDDDDDMDGSSFVENVVAADTADQSQSALRVEASTPDLRDFDCSKEDGTPVIKELSDDGAEVLPDSASGVPASAGEPEEVWSCDTLEKRFRLQLKELERTQEHKELERQQMEESLKERENLLLKELAEERQKRLLKIEEEVSRLNEENQKREAEFVEEKEMMSKKLDESLQESKLEIERLSDRVKLQREALKQMTQEKNSQEEQQRRASATKIQTRFRGFRVRKIYGASVKEKIAEIKELRRNNRLKVIEERIKLEEEKKREEERKRIEEEERKRRLEEEETRRIEEEKQRKEEEVKRKKEEERLKKEEEKRAKEEAKRQKKEEERKRKELEKLKKEEEKRKKEKKDEEEKKRKEEEERLKKEACERKKTEEILRKEEEERRKVKEMKINEEERKQEEEIRKKISQERSLQDLESIQRIEPLMKYEVKDEKLEQTDKAKTNGVDEGHVGQKILETDGATNTEKNSEKEPIKRVVVAEDLKLMATQKVGSSLDKSELNLLEQKPDARESFPRAPEVSETKKPPMRVQQNRRVKEQNKTSEVSENVGKSVEARRLAWMKENQSWSKSLSKLRSQKVVRSQNSLRVPSSAKNLPALDEKLILLSSKAARLNQVTSIELRDISACSLKTLSQCVHLKYLVMNNCSIVATEGLERLSGLQYVDLKNNKLEMMNFVDLVNLTYLDVSKNSLRSICGLTGCTSLRYLNVSNNRITRISGLESLDRLHTLIASGNQMISTKGLADVPSVQVLDLSHNRLSIVDDVEHLGMLRTLDLQSNDFMTVPLLTNQVLLCDLLLDKNSLSSLTNLSQAWLPCLSHLGLSENRLTCLVDLRFCIFLQSLNLSNNLIRDINSISVGLMSCQRLESMNVTGNPVVEDTNYRNTLLSTIKSLRYLNEERQTDSVFVLSVDLDSWLSTCLSHVDGYRHLHEDYLKSLKTAGNDLSNIYSVHERYFTSSHDLATEHRFFHEYGGKMLPQPPITPKVSSLEESNSMSFEKSTHVDSTAETINMKAKFEQALLSASSCKNTQPSVKTDLDEKELKSNVETTDKRFSSETSLNRKSPLREKPTLLKNEVERSLSPKNFGLQSSAATEPNDIRWSSVEAGVGKGGGSGGRISRLPQPAINDSTVQTLKVKRSQEIEKESSQTKLYSENVVYLDKAATKIQSLWRGYSFRKRFQHILNDAHLTDDVADDMDFDDFNIEALMPNDLCFDKDFVLPPTPRNPNKNNAASDHVLTDYQSLNPDLELPPFPRQAWRSGATPSPLGELIPPRGLRPYPPGKPPLPPSSRLSNLTDAHSNTTAGRSIRQEKIMEEWDFKNPRTAELFLQRARKMDQLGRNKKFTDLDPIKRLAIMRRLEETNKVPLTSVTHKRERPLPRKEYFKALREQEEQRDSEVEKERHQKAEYTFEWLHTQVRHCDSRFSLKRGGSEGSLPQINPTSLGGKVSAMAGSPPSQDLHSVDGASTANGSVKQQRLSFNSDKLPPLSVNSKPSSAGLTHEMSWHSAEVNQSVGWGGGKKRAHQRR